MDFQQILSNISAITNYAGIRILIVILIALIGQKVVKKIIEWLFRVRVKSNLFTSNTKEREKRLKTLGSISEATAAMIVWFIAIIYILGILHVPVAPLLTSAGLIGAALAFSTQSIIRDYLSGIFIIAENQYRVDDYIELDKASGYVQSITTRTTVIKGENGAIYHVPNGTITTTANFSFAKIQARQQLELDASITIEKAEKLLSTIAKKISQDESLNKFITLGPSLISIDKITSKGVSITIGYETTPKKRSHATNIIWKELNAAKLPFA